MARINIETKEGLLFNEDYLWMSWRYCIGRHTIAAHMHASTIATDAYGKLSPERSQFNSEDINSEIHNCLHVHNFVNMVWYGNIPKTHFKPLDVVYSILDKESIDTLEKIAKIKELRIDWNYKKNEFDYSIYYFNYDDKDKDLGRSLWNITDLEVWQQLANLFDLNGHKWCKLVDGTLCEYYESWEHYNTEDKKIKFRKKKHPVDRYYNFNTYIPEENILEDNVEPNK